MLISFHYCVILIFQILRNRKRLKSVNGSPSNTVLDDSDLENNLIFDPPVYRQRYSKVHETLLNEKWRNNIDKLVDFGCAELGLFIYVKNLNIKQVLFVDIDESLLQEKIGNIEPLLVDRLRRRSCPLEVSVFAGSVAHPDYRLQKTDAVTAIELIEHLYPDTLDAFSYNIFAFVQPKIALITTPNADFNVLFKRDGFRHWDHKFEWTREQFEDWANNVVERFPKYTVEFSGVGQGSEDTKNLGCCSQIALFLRKDFLYDEYISPEYAEFCLCDKSSLCKGQTAECKLLCNCICSLCLPDFSVGICTYLSSSKQNSDEDVQHCSSQPYYDNKNEPIDYTLSEDRLSMLYSDINHSHNIYYKLIQKIDYPYEVETRSENERLLQTFQYRIHNFSHFNSRFYVSTKEHCEIPITDIMYGDINLLAEEVSRLLIKAGYQIEKCTIQETQSCEDCIISVPREMEDITSSSEVTDDYSSKSSEPNDSTKFEVNTEPLSDWDEVPCTPAPTEQGHTSTSLEPSAEAKRPNPDPLFDSGYLKSPSPLDNNSKLPQLPPQDNPELVETDHFEDVLSTPRLSTEDNKLHLRKSVAKEKFGGALMLESQKPKYDPNRVNELDRFHNMSTAKTFMNNFLKPQSDFKKPPFKDLSVAGPSSGWKKSKKSKDKKVIEKKETGEPSPLDDAKSITNCIIQNSLNKIEVGDEIIGRQVELIRDLNPPSPPPEVNQGAVAIPEQQQAGNVAPLEAIPQVLARPQGVENGDLANNNRDNEGNNFVANIQEQDIDEGIDLLNDNLEELVPLLQDNVNVFDNNNDLVVHGQRLELAQPVELQDRDVFEENADRVELELDGCSEADDSVAHASQEALFDANSEQDLLEDFDIPPQAVHDDVFDMLNLSGNVLLVGVHAVSSSGARRDQSPAAASIQANTGSFPNWLLQILGNHMAPDEVPVEPLGSHDEPHFYCQGDGLGVHPSVIAIEVDEAEDADNDTSTEESSSSNNTADFAEVEPGPSDMFDMSSLPEESSLATSLVDDNTAIAVRAADSVVWADRGGSDDVLEHNRLGSIDDSTDDSILNEHILQGTDLVEDIIRTAEREVTLRSQEDVVLPEISQERNSGNLTPPPSCCIVAMSDSFDVVMPPAEDHKREETTHAECPEAAVSVQSSEDSDEQYEGLKDQSEGNILDTHSSSGSEQSEYYET